MRGYLLDTNVLVALLWPSHGQHEAAVGWFARRRAKGWATCPLTEAGFVRIDGPRSRPVLGGRHGLTQRVPLLGAYRMSLDLRAERPADILVRVCESHLLYDRACQSAFFRVLPTPGGAEWQRRQFNLSGPPLHAGVWFAPRQGVLTLSVLGAGSSVDIDNVVLESAGGQRLLANGDFSADLAQWLPAAQSYFLPWHIDNLFLELLIERGLVLVGNIGAREAVSLDEFPEDSQVSRMAQQQDMDESRLMEYLRALDLVVLERNQPGLKLTGMQAVSEGGRLLTKGKWREPAWYSVDATPYDTDYFPKALASPAWGLGMEVQGEDPWEFVLDGARIGVRMNYRGSCSIAAETMAVRDKIFDGLVRSSC